MRISVTGTPGVGKTTVSKLVARKLGFRYLDVGGFAKEKGFIVGREGGSDIVDEKKVKVRLSRMDDCVLDWHCSETLGADYVCVLRLPPLLLLERLSKKRYSKRKLKENLLAEMLDVCLASALMRNPSRNVFEILNKDSHKTALQIVRIVKNKDRRKSFKGRSICNFLTIRNLEWIRDV